MEKQDFQKLITRYLNGDATLDEIKGLVNYYESFQENKEWISALGSEDPIKDRILNNILNVIDETPVKTIPLYKKPFFKLALAASVALLVSLALIFNKSESDSKTTSIVINNTIKAGNTKATLTLEDGSNVVLENGKTFKTNTLNSDGEQIIYEELDHKKTAYNYLTIPRGGAFFIKLPDGTQVWLNSESKLKYPISFKGNDTRLVELVYGEAYFKVSPSTKHNGATFKVLSNAQEIEVLGTQFNIKSYKEEANTYTTLVEGSVAVFAQNTHKILKPSQQAIVNSTTNEFKIATADVYREIAWKDGVFSFKGKSLKEITKVLSRWYDLEVVFENTALENQRFRGTFNKSQKIIDLLETLENSDIINSYEINRNKVILR